MDIQIKTAPVGRGVGWLTDALSIVTANPLGWIAAHVVVFIIGGVIGIIPLGSLLVTIINPVFVGGCMLGCQAHAAGKGFEFRHAFAGLQSPYIKRLVVLGVIFSLINFVILVVSFMGVLLVFGGMEFFQQFNNMQPEDLAALTQPLMLIVLLASVMIVPVTMLMFFAPVLIVSTDVTAIRAMKLSFKACMYNIPALSLYGVVAAFLLILAAIPLLLGFLILFPLLMASFYVAFKDCFDITDALSVPENKLEPMAT